MTDEEDIRESGADVGAPQGIAAMLLLLPGMVSLATEVGMRGGYDLVMLGAALNLLAGIFAYALLRWAPGWLGFAVMGWLAVSLGNALLFQLVVLGLERTAVLALVLPPVVIAGYIYLRFRPRQ